MPPPFYRPPRSLYAWAAGDIPPALLPRIQFETELAPDYLTGMLRNETSEAVRHLRGEIETTATGDYSGFRTRIVTPGESFDISVVQRDVGLGAQQTVNIEAGAVDVNELLRLQGIDTDLANVTSTTPIRGPDPTNESEPAAAPASSAESGIEATPADYVPPATEAAPAEPAPVEGETYSEPPPEDQAMVEAQNIILIQGPFP